MSDIPRVLCLFGVGRVMGTCWLAGMGPPRIVDNPRTLFRGANPRILKGDPRSGSPAPEAPHAPKALKAQETQVQLGPR